MTDVPTRLESLSPARRALLEQLRREREDRIVRRLDSTDAPLSFAQQRMWFLDQYSPDSPLHNVYAAVRMSGAMEREVLAHAVGTICRRHEVLRTVYRTRDGVASQVVLPPAPVDIPLLDLGDVPPAEREARALETAAEQARIPFDLERGPLLRVDLLRLEATDHVVVFTMHHIVSDGWSMGVFVDELTTLYRAYSADLDDPLPDLAVQYVDFARWHRDRLVGDDLRAELDHWRNALSGAPQLLELPTDRPRSEQRSEDGRRQVFSVPAKVRDGLTELCRSEQATTFMASLAAFTVLLGRYSGQQDVCVGTPIANRTRSELEGLIGFFVNTLVLRGDVSGNPTFRQLLRRIRDTTWQAYEHQEVPFERLVEELQPERDPAYTPLFQVMFAMQNAPMPTLIAPGMTLRALDMHNGTSKFDLTLMLTENDSGFDGWVEYATSLFDDDTVARLVEHYRTLLGEIAANPDRPLSALPMLTAAEHRRIVLDWNQTRTNQEITRPVFELIAERAARTPEAEAINAFGSVLDYRELDQRANALAHRLVGLGVGPDVPVGVCLERSADLIVVLLAVLKAGGAYLPLEPDHPADRLRFMRSDAGAAVVVTRPETAVVFDDVPVVALTDGWARTAPEAAEPPRPGVDGNSLAHVIYTSGSTGHPKGVMSTHRGLTNYMLWMQDRYRLTEQDRVLVKTPFSFDISLAELVWPLLAGSCQVLSRPDGHRDPGHLVERILAERVSIVHVVPSMLPALLDEPGFAGRTDLRMVLCGGETLVTDLADRFLHALDGVELHNLYGPTEASIDVTVWECLPGRTRPTVPIGRPIGNTRTHVLDEWLNPVPVGVAGELYAAGAGLARGYLNQPGLTAERFLPDPFATGPGERMYRTGDRARLLPDGAIEYVDRVDRQVKIRGFRVELGEVEAVLGGHPAVRQAAAAVVSGGGQPARLVGYVESAGPQPTIQDLREHLRARLPEHLVPTSWVFLDALPLTSRGKVDRAALPGPDDTRPDVGEFVPPATEVESVLCEVWTSVLGVDRVGVEDGYFAIGGDSIRSIQVLALARERGLELTLQQLFRHQTIRALADEIARSAPAAPPPSTPFSLVSEADRRRLPSGVEDAYPLSVMQASLIFESELRSEQTFGHRVHSFRLRGRFAQEALREAIAWVIARHPILRSSVDLGSYERPLQLVHQEVPTPLAVEDLRELPQQEQDERLRCWLSSEQDRGFRLDAAPLLRLHVHRRTDEEFQFSLSGTTVVLDGWSNATFLSELFLAYQARLTDSAMPSTPAPASRYRDFVRTELTALESAEHKSYWQRILDSGEPSPQPRLSIQDEEVATRRHAELSIDAPVHEGLRALARRAGAPLKSVLLTAHLWVMSRITGHRDVATGLVSNGRPEETDGERVLGQFLNVVPLAVRPEPGSWVDLVRQVFDAEREGLPFRHYPVASLQPGQAGAQRFETAFNFVHFHVYRAFDEVGELELVDAWDTDTTNFALFAEFSISTTTDGLQLDLDCDATTTGADQFAELGRCYREILAAMANDPAGHHERFQFPTVSPAPTPASTAPAETPAELFEQQARRSPQATALVSGKRRITFAELNERANRWAHHLRDRGVGPEVPVGVCLDRDVDLVVVLLGILKAGGVYVPIDPGHPGPRQAAMLSDARVRLLVAADDADHDVETIAVGQVTGRDRTGPPVKTTRDSLACVIFTSGSTGRPKGVGITHAKVLNRLDWNWTAYPFHPGEMSCHKTRIGFVDSLWELLGPLLAGSPTAIVSDAEATDPYLLTEVLAEHRVTRILLVPTLLRMVIEAHDDLQTRLPELTLWTTSGESLPSDLVDLFAERMPSARLVNVYGSSEAWDTAWLETDRHTAMRVTPAGSPLPNVRIHVLDDWLRPVPPGVPGELYVGGPVARGYVHAPARTAERFVTDPFSTGQRLYRTGDRACLLPDGTLVLAGRVDQQLNVGGNRVEPVEVESALRQHPAVRDAVVIADAGGMTAFLVADGDVPEADALRCFVAERLPEYMIPGRMVVIDEFPLTASGKVDRRALAARDVPAEAEPSDAPGPRTPAEEIIAGIWAHVLHRGTPAVTENFFAAGGDSLRATQAMARVRTAFGVDLSVRDLFSHPTVAELARAVSAAADSTTAPLRAEASDPAAPKPLSFAQQRLWFLDQLEPGSAANNVELAVRLSGELDVPTLRRALTELVQRHETLRMTFSATGDEPTLTVNQVPEGLLTEVELDGEDAAAEHVSTEVRRPFDLSAGPLLRATLIHLGGQEHIAVLVMHHIVCDAWSVQVLLAELTTLYTAFLAGSTSPLPELEVHYTDYSRWQRTVLTDRYEQLVSYWRTKLDGAAPLHDLVPDHARTDSHVPRGGVEERTLPVRVADAVRALGSASRTTLFMNLLAAFAIVIHARTGREDIIVGTDIAGRDEPGLEPLVGFFINQLVLRLDLAGDPDFRELLDRVRETSLAAHSHDLPFDRLVSEVRPERNAGHSPVFQVKLVHQNVPRRHASIPGLRVEPFPVNRDTTQLDLNLRVSEESTGLLLSAEFDAQLYDPATIGLLLSQLELVLEAVAENPGLRLRELRERLAERAAEQLRSTSLGRLRNARRKRASRP